MEKLNRELDYNILNCKLYLSNVYLPLLDNRLKAAHYANTVVTGSMVNNSWKDINNEVNIVVLDWQCCCLA